MNLYEKVLIINPDLDDAAADEAVGKITDLISKKGGEILRMDRWGRRKLAYVLNKHEKGNYFIILFKAPPSTIAELERLCKVLDAVIKFMVVKYEKKRHVEAVLASLKEAATKEKTEDAPVSAESEESASEDAPEGAAEAESV
jgi:small subunit ribosomal protein S6